MKLSHPRRWDWPSIILLVFMVQVATARLVVTEWTEYLFFAQTLAALGLFLGLALGYSQYKRRTVILLTLGYSFILIPSQLTLAIEDVYLTDRLASVGGRLLFSMTQFFQREPVEDGLLFVAFISTLCWFLCLVSGYWWTRHENYLVTVLPGWVFILVIHLYNQFFSSRIWILAIYILLALLLLGQLYYLKNRESWRERRVLQMQESTFDLTRGMVISASLFVFVAWTVPASQAGLDSAKRQWKRITEPWRDLQEWFSNAVEGLEAPTVFRSSDLYGSQLGLGTGNSLSEDVVFSVEAPDLPEKHPRYYWRGYVYDFYQNHRWYATNSTRSEFLPEETELLVPNMGELTIADFTVKAWIPQSLLYTASQPLWVSRPGEIDFSSTDTDEQDLLAWRSGTRIPTGEQYQVTAALINPSIQQLQKAGTDYPQWVTDRYLQLPDDFSPRIVELTALITQGSETPYDKAAIITDYLRSEITYTNPLPDPLPKGEDSLEWILFDIKKGFCNYYASAEILMLRSQGVPARMAVGFAEGNFDDEANAYSVLSLDAHAWPEVYFPDIGWIEFEPTGNQEPLIRPNRPEDDEAQELNGEPGGILNPLGLNSIDEFRERKLDFDEGLTETDELTDLDLQPTTNPVYYALLAASLLGLFWLINRQYSVLDQIPVRIRIAYERNGGRPPAWLINWARWATLTPTERAFETVNRSLRLLGESPAYHATPTERVELLTKKLPTATNQIEILSDQHLASLFTPNPGNVGRARRASLSIWLYTIHSIIKRILYGRSIE